MPSLLLIDSCGAYRISSDNDPLAGEGWKRLQIERLPPNSTSVTQPLDGGAISVFKRHYLEMLSDKEILKAYTSGNKITNGEAWSLIPYAWSHVKASTLRHCFHATGVLPKAMADKLEKASVDMKERPALHPNVADSDKLQVKRCYLRMIATVADGDNIEFSLDKNQKDAQDMAEDVKQTVLARIAKRYARRERSSFTESDAVKSFKSKHEGESLATMVVDML
ncbi:Tigger transposable element-derived protein 6, partial [Haplosporangium sp. Z 767]